MPSCHDALSSKIALAKHQSSSEEVWQYVLSQVGWLTFTASRV